MRAAVHNGIAGKLIGFVILILAIYNQEFTSKVITSIIWFFAKIAEFFGNLYVQEIMKRFSN